MASPKQTIGHNAEEKAKIYLEKEGLQSLDQNYLCKMGEIDLVMKEGDYIVFVEVRFRDNENYTAALESITPSKQNKVIKAATYFLLENNLYNKVDCRFDVVVMDNLEIHWIKNAFSVEAYS